MSEKSKNELEKINEDKFEDKSEDMFQRYNSNETSKKNDDKFVGVNETNPFAGIFQKYGINLSENSTMEDLFNIDEKKHNPLSKINEKGNKSNKKEKQNENTNR